ncbi:MAG: hypothetical protein U9O83_05025, partial [Campylobacterota bacterium]|nr:hypothetical protein [Campylobacterota bacterium]
MNFNTSSLFDKESKKLSKKFNLLKSDLKNFVDNFDNLHLQAIPIKDKLFKIRLANSNKNRGKSAGYRIYYYLKVENNVYLLTIYDKSQKDTIDEDILID